MNGRFGRASALGVGLVVLAVVAGPTGGASAGGAASMPTTSPQIAGGAVVAVHRYRLVTGDTVRVLTRADGTSVPRVEGGTPFIWSGGREGLVVVPRTAPPLLRGIDPSLFDTSALARVTRNGRTPVVIRFTDPVRHAVPAGVHVVSGTARTAGGGTVVHATFGRHFAGFDQRDLRDIASVGLDAREPRASAEAATGPTHTVQFHVVNKRGAAAEFAMVTMQNTVDGMSYLEQVDVDDNGVAAFTDVPEGEYSAVVQTFQQVLVDRQFVVTADRTIEMNLGDATVRPHVTLRDHHPIWTDISVERDPEDGFGIPFGAAGPHFGFRVQPTPGHVRHGALRTGVTATLVQGRKANGYDDVALTADAGRGVPDDLTFVHHRREFARLTDLFYGNGPAADRTLMLFPGNVHAGLAIGETDLQVPVPGRFHVWVQACPGCYAQQTVFPLATGGSFDENTQVGDVRRYRKPGNRPPLRFLHGPVGPGLELPPHSRFSAGASRRGHHLQFFVPLMGGWGASTFDFADPRAATWSLHQGRRTLARGHQVIAANVRVPPGPRTYRLLAHTHPGPAWDLSTHVRDVWTFGSRAGDMNVPLLTPHYLPPTNLAGDLGPGHTGFRLSFHSTPHSPRVAQVTVELSTNDGRSWHPVHTTRTSGLTFHVGYHNPAAHAGTRYASLRVTARDTQGNTVQETAFHAYRLG